MIRYTCYKCKSEHGTDNMVSVCIACYQKVKDELDRSEKLVQELILLPEDKDPEE